MASLQTSRPPRSMRAAAAAALEILALDRVFSAGPRSFVSWRGWSGDEVTRRGGFSEQFSTGGMRAWTISQRCEDSKRLSGIFLRNFFTLASSLAGCPSYLTLNGIFGGAVPHPRRSQQLAGASVSRVRVWFSRLQASSWTDREG